jgi:hypothetical protein
VLGKTCEKIQERERLTVAFDSGFSPSRVRVFFFLQEKVVLGRVCDKVEEHKQQQKSNFFFKGRVTRSKSVSNNGFGFSRILTRMRFVFFIWQQNPRLVLCEATAVVMKKGMFLLGITPLEKI